MSNQAKVLVMFLAVIYVATQTLVVGTLAVTTVLLSQRVTTFRIGDLRTVRVAGEIVGKTQATATILPTKTRRPTFTPLPPLKVAGVTATPTPTSRPTSTPRATATRTKVPPTRTAVPTKAATPAGSQSPYSFRVDAIRCYHSGQSFVEGVVLETTANLFSGINGVRVRISNDPGGSPVAQDAVTEEHMLMDEIFLPNKYSGYFNHVVNASGPAPGQTRYVWVVDGSGQALSDPGAGKAVFDGGKGDNACWNVQVVFVKFQ